VNVLLVVAVRACTLHLCILSEPLALCIAYIALESLALCIAYIALQSLALCIAYLSHRELVDDEENICYS
jgi:hypothetical protein